MFATALGIFLTVQPDAPAAAQQAAIASIADPAVSGFSLWLNWSDINPAPGVYDWSAVDLYALPAMAVNKPLAVGVAAGGDTPAWLFARPYSVPSQVFLSSGPQPVFKCTTAVQPPPWNAAFQSSWAAMQQALSAHLQAIGARVVQVKLTGLNHTTTEFNMESQTAPQPGSSCTVSDATAQWQALRYLPRLAKRAAAESFQAVRAAFPGVPAVLPFIANNALPKISTAGTSTDPATAETYFDQIVTTTVQGHAGVQWNSLANNYPIPAIWLRQVAQGAYGVLQTPAFTAGGLGTPCAPPDHPAACSDALFGQQLQLGIASGACMIEVWSGDFIYEDQIAQANQTLLAKPGCV